MSLRFKLSLFTALFVLLASVALLIISNSQHIDKKNRDIKTLIDLRDKGSDINTLIATRVEQIQADSNTMISERIVYSLALLFLVTIVIFLFSKPIIKPLKRLVVLAEEIAKGQKKFSV